jgi:hypothetical protein
MLQQRLCSSAHFFYAVRVTATQRKPIKDHLPSGGSQPLTADEWFDGYLRLLLRIRHEHLEQPNRSSCPQTAVDDSNGTGTVSTHLR